MSNLDLFFQKPTPPAAGAARASSAAAPARKSVQAASQSRGGRDFDDLMSRLADEPRRESPRVQTGVREQAPAPRDKKHGDVAPAESAATATAPTPQQPSASAAAPAQHTRPQGGAQDGSREDPQESSGDQPSERVTGEMSGGAAASKNAAEAAAQAAAHAAAGATALFLASTPIAASATTGAAETTGATGDASASGAADARGARDAAAQGSVGEILVATSAAAAAPGDSTPIAPGQPRPTPAELAALARAAADAASAAPRTGGSTPAVPTAQANDAALAPTGVAIPEAPAAIASGTTPAGAGANGTSVTPTSSSTEQSAAAGYQPMQTPVTGLPDLARQQASADLRAALVQLGRPTGKATISAGSGPSAPASFAGAATAPGTASPQASGDAAIAGSSALGSGVAASAANTSASANVLASGVAGTGDRLAASKAADQQASIAAADAPTIVDAAATAAGGQGQGTAGDGAPRGGGNGSSGFAPPMPQPASFDASTSSTQMPFDPRGFGVTPTTGGVAPFSGPAAGTPFASSTLPMTEADSQQIIRGMRLQWRGPVGEAQLTLRPEHLGQVTVTVRVDHGAVSATLRAETPAAQQWMQAHQQDLRQALQQQGLEVAEVVITTDPDDRQQGGQQTKDDGEASRQRRPQPRGEMAAQQPRFEIRV